MLSDATEGLEFSSWTDHRGKGEILAEPHMPKLERGIAYTIDGGYEIAVNSPLLPEKFTMP